MVSTTVTVQNKTGLHARPASQLIALCSKFESKLRILNGDDEIDPKSIISVLSGGIKQGTAVELTAEGSDEETAIQQIVALIESLTE